MPVFGTKSAMKRDLLNHDLKAVVDAAIQIYDFSIIETFRSEDEQNAAFENGYILF